MKVKTKINVKLLKKIRKHILAEPKRLLMGGWIAQKTDDRPYFYNDADKKTSFPKCNTAACIAGWAVMLHDKKPPKNTTIKERAIKLLGLEPSTEEYLFHVQSWEYGDEYWEAKSPKAKAKVAAKEIDYFIKTNKELATNKEQATNKKRS